MNEDKVNDLVIVIRKHEERPAPHNRKMTTLSRAVYADSAECYLLLIDGWEPTHWDAAAIPTDKGVGIRQVIHLTKWGDAVEDAKVFLKRLGIDLDAERAELG